MYMHSQTRMRESIPPCKCNTWVHAGKKKEKKKKTEKNESPDGSSTLSRRAQKCSLPRKWHLYDKHYSHFSSVRSAEFKYWPKRICFGAGFSLTARGEANNVSFKLIRLRLAQYWSFEMLNFVFYSHSHCVVNVGKDIRKCYGQYAVTVLPPLYVVRVRIGKKESSPEREF